MTSRPARRRYLRMLALLGALAALTVPLGLIAGHAAASWKLRRELRAWEDTGTSMQALRARWPRRPDSAAALELDRLARPLGVRLARAAGPQPQIGDKPTYEAMGKWLGQLAKGSDDGYDATPPDVRAFLEAHRAEVSALAEYLQGASDIAWEMDLGAAYEAPVPNMLAHRYLNTVLLAEALERSRRGDAAGAERTLDAAWRHGETLASRPELISHLIAIGLAGQHGNVLRRVASESPSWPERLRQRHYLAAVIDSFQYEAHTSLTVAQTYRGYRDRDAGLLGGQGASSWMARVATGPWMRMSLCSASGHYRRGQELVRAADACRVTGENLEAALASEIWRFDVVARVVVPGVMRAVTSAAGADLDGELTRLVLQAPRAGDGPSDVPSTVCKSVTWRQVREPDGRWRIQADPLPELDPDRPDRWTFVVTPGPATPPP